MQTPSLGVIDWGIGGIGIVQLLKSRLGDVPVLYFSDTGVTPYGRMSRGELVARLDAVIGFLRSQGATHLVLGCNAASTALPYLDKHGLPVEGMIDSAVRALLRLRPTRAALIGGRRTVLSGVYRRALAGHEVRVEQRIAQPLSALIERGDISSTTLHAECARILAPLRGCSHLLLACTHYPAIAPVLRSYLSERTVIVDPAEELVRTIAGWKLPAGGTDRFFTSGDSDGMQGAALTAFGYRLTGVEQVSLRASDVGVQE
jgi:glutamate racemase